MSNTIQISFANETHSIEDWAKITGFSESVIRKRYHAGWTPREILTTVPQGKMNKRANMFKSMVKKKVEEERAERYFQERKKMVKEGLCPQVGGKTTMVRTGSGVRFGS